MGKIWHTTQTQPIKNMSKTKEKKLLLMPSQGAVAHREKADDTCFLLDRLAIQSDSSGLSNWLYST